MEYLVHIESCNYHFWQLQLLIESLKYLGLEENLVVTYSGDMSFGIDRSYFINHLGNELGLPALTKIYAAWVALKQGVISQPFVILEPDMILVKPIDQSSKPIAAQRIGWMERSSIELFYEYCKLPTINWNPVGEIYQFNDVSDDLFESIINTSCAFGNKHKDRFRRDIVGIALGISRSKYDCEVVDNYESSLDYKQYVYDEEANVIHYTKGLSPYFRKEMYDDRKFFYRCPFPWQDIANIPVWEENKNVKLIKELARDYFKS